MPRIKAAVALLAVAVFCIGFNAVRYPAVWDMVAASTEPASAKRASESATSPGGPDGSIPAPPTASIRGGEPGDSIHSGPSTERDSFSAESDAGSAAWEGYGSNHRQQSEQTALSDQTAYDTASPDKTGSDHPYGSTPISPSAGSRDSSGWGSGDTQTGQYSSGYEGAGAQHPRESGPAAGSQQRASSGTDPSAGGPLSSTSEYAAPRAAVADASGSQGRELKTKASAKQGSRPGAKTAAAAKSKTSKRGSKVTNNPGIKTAAASCGTGCTGSTCGLPPTTGTFGSDRSAGILPAPVGTTGDSFGRDTRPISPTVDHEGTRVAKGNSWGYDEPSPREGLPAMVPVVASTRPTGPSYPSGEHQDAFGQHGAGSSGLEDGQTPARGSWGSEVGGISAIEGRSAWGRAGWPGAGPPAGSADSEVRRLPPLEQTAEDAAPYSDLGSDSSVPIYPVTRPQ